MRSERIVAYQGTRYSAWQQESGVRISDTKKTRHYIIGGIKFVKMKFEYAVDLTKITLVINEYTSLNSSLDAAVS